ncbi:hypothetical protein SEEK0253_22810 [Salmonella enterica subsp. enterica serovar Kentucky str. 0253]|nr:hypothetical protein SEEK0253_22810 [Salmonella enterica subsp. enterica serovar Kentucky str. 0253]
MPDKNNVQKTGWESIKLCSDIKKGK